MVGGGSQTTNRHLRVGAVWKMEALRSAGQVEKPLTPQGRVIVAQSIPPREEPFSPEVVRPLQRGGVLVSCSGEKESNGVHQTDQGCEIGPFDVLVQFF